MRWRLVTLACALLTTVVQAQEIRTWTSRAGGFSVEASLEDVVNGNVVLKKSDGATLSVPLEKLSLGDVRYIDTVMREAQSAVVGKEMKESPADAPEPDAITPEMDDSTDKDAVRGRTPPLTSPNRSTWQVAPDLGEIALMKAARRLAIPTPTRFGSLKVILPESASPYAGVFQQSTPAVLTCFDIRSGRKSGQLEFANGFVQHIALSPDGRQVAWHTAGQKSVSIAALTGNRRPTELDLGEPFASVNYLAFSNRDTLLVSNVSAQSLGVWSLKSKTKEHSIPLPPGTDGKLMTLSHGGHYLAVAPRSQGTIQIYDLRNGAMAGRLEMPPSQSGTVVHSIEAVAFSQDGQEISVIYSGSQSSGINIWRINNGELAKQIEFKQSLSSLASGMYSDGFVLQYLPDEKGWLLHGRAVIDRAVGSLVWTDPDQSPSATMSRRRVLNDGRVLALRGETASLSLSAESLPWDEIERGGKVVAKGGRSEDAGLPELSQAKMSGASQETFREAPAWTAVEPALVPEKIKVQPISIGTPASLLTKFEFVDAPIAMLVTPRKDPNGSFGTQANQVQSINVDTGKIVDTLNVETAGEYLDFSPSGKLALMRTGKKLDRLDIFQVETGKHMIGFRPDNDSQHPTMVTWAGFTDEDHLVSLTPTGGMFHWEIPSCKAQAATKFDLIRGNNFVPTTCWMTPSRKLLLVAAAGKLHAVDSSTLVCLGTLEATSSMRGAWNPLAFALSPNGERLAVEIKHGEDTTLAIWDFTNGKLLAENSLVMPGLELTWADDKYLMVHGFRINQNVRYNSAEQSTVLDLIDVQRGQVVWRYVLPFGRTAQRGPDNRIWYASSTSFIGQGTLMGVELPSPAATAAINKLPPQVPILEKGGEVTLDVQFSALGAPAGIDLITDAIQADLSKQLLARGVQVKPRTGLVLVVTISEKRTQNRLRFKMLATGEEQSIQETRVDCELTLKDVTGTTLWQRTQAFYNEGQRLVETVPAGVSAADHLRRLQWREVMKWFEDGGLPEKIYEPLPVAGLGESLLGPLGETNVQTY
ncbi:MAG: SHD1 domain-containing protein [Pirellulaceae bacterium]